MFDDSVRRTLRGLIREHGTELTHDAKRTAAFLNDLCPGKAREINLIVGALQQRIPSELLTVRPDQPGELVQARLAAQLVNHLSITEEAAQWAVDAWSDALAASVSPPSLACLPEQRAVSWRAAFLRRVTQLFRGTRVRVSVEPTELRGGGPVDVRVQISNRKRPVSARVVEVTASLPGGAVRTVGQSDDYGELSWMFHAPRVDAPLAVRIRALVDDPAAQRRREAWATLRLRPLPVVVSRKGQAYHRSECPWVGAMSPRNRHSLRSTAEAQRRGYYPCGECRPNL